MEINKMSDQQVTKPQDLTNAPKSEEYTLRETVNLLGSEWLRAFDTARLKEYRRGDLVGTSKILKRLNEFHRFASKKPVPAADESAVQMSQTTRKYFPCKIEYGRMTSSGSQSLWAPIKAVLFEGVGTDLDQCKSAATSLTWLLKIFPMADKCYTLQEFMLDPDSFLQQVQSDKGWNKKQAKTYLNTVFFEFMNKRMNFGNTEGMEKMRKLRLEACAM